MTAADKQGCRTLLTRLFRKPSTAKPTEQLPYRINRKFLSPAEISFYHVLNQAIQGKAIICPKVRMVDLFYILNLRENFSYRAKIAQKHIDFTLCDPQTMQPILCIELDDSSHQRLDREERDAFVDQVFQVAQLPLIHQPAQTSYNTSEIASVVLPYIENAPKQPETPLCPKCGIPMVLKTARRGKYQGGQFWACPNYPECRETMPT
ncbi:MAG: DUF2726 domain-containing protein [Anaerolineae bacterium]|nr:DUF2726 domain-containing protein [Anaerolineae bacterium]